MPTWREVAETVLPHYGSKYSKRLFPRPSLLAILCLMRYEDWTWREAEVRLGEQQELRAALGGERVPDYTTLYRFPGRVEHVHSTDPLGDLPWSGAISRARLLPTNTPLAFTIDIHLGDTLARLAVGEAIVGMAIEITFIATFT